MAATTFTGALTAVAATLSAVAASTAVWVAIVRPRLTSPRLTILEPEHERELVVADLSSGVPSAWLRLAVSASAGREAAEEVEIVILRVTEIEPRTGRKPKRAKPDVGRLVSWARFVWRP